MSQVSELTVTAAESVDVVSVAEELTKENLEGLFEDAPLVISDSENVFD